MSVEWRDQAARLAADGKVGDAIVLLQAQAADWAAWHDLGVYRVSQAYVAGAFKRLPPISTRQLPCPRKKRGSQKRDGSREDL